MITFLSLVTVVLFVLAQIEYFEERPAHILWPAPGLMCLPFDSAAMAALAGLLLALAEFKFWPLLILLPFLAYGFARACRAIVPVLIGYSRTQCRPIVFETCLYQAPAISVLTLSLIVCVLGDGPAKCSVEPSEPSGTPSEQSFTPSEPSLAPGNPTLQRAVLCTHSIEEARKDMGVTLGQYDSESRHGPGSHQRQDWTFANLRFTGVYTPSFGAKDANLPPFC